MLQNADGTNQAAPISHPRNGQHEPPLIVHMINRLAVGGLENGLVNLIDHMPTHRYRHAIICLTNYNDFRNRMRRKDVPVIALLKHPGHDLGSYVRMWRVLRALAPAIVHTRNLPTLEYLLVAKAAGVRGLIHGEHGRDVYDLDGANVKYNLLRRGFRPLIHHYTAVSGDLRDWLVQGIGVNRNRVTQIYNGVDTQRFHPWLGARPPIGPPGFSSNSTTVIGTVGRMEKVKDQLTLVRAFMHLVRTKPSFRRSLRLVMIGDGPLRKESETLLRNAGLESLAWLPGECADVPEKIRALNLFVLPSRAEGVSNTILEAMASGLPVVATRVGGNPELIEDGNTGLLIPPSHPPAMAEAIRAYLDNPTLLARHGEAGRKRAEQQFSLQSMVEGYLDVYDSVLNETAHRVSSLVGSTIAS